MKKIDYFYESETWNKLRYAALKKFGRKCMCCGDESKTTAYQVDHIKPRSKYPELEKDPNNLQVLCASCNSGKGANHEDDFRPKPMPKGTLIPVYDRQLLPFLLNHKIFLDVFLESKNKIPSHYKISDYFNNKELMEWVDKFVASGFDDELLEIDNLVIGLSRELQSTIFESKLTEITMLAEEHLNILIKKGIHKIWVMFSHNLKYQMGEADKKGDEKEFKELSSMFLDLQHKLKKFESEYIQRK